MQFELVAVGPDDAAAIHDLSRRWETHWKVPIATSMDEIVEEFEDPHLDADLDTRGVWMDSRLAAVGYVQHTPSGERQERVFVGGRVDPEMRGNGIGRRLLAWQVERATEKLRSCDPAIPWFIRTHEWDWIDDALRLYGRFGFESVRWFQDMMRALEPPLRVEQPDGVELVAWDDAPGEEVRQLSNAAFADHWGSTPRDAAAWQHLMDSSTIRTDLSVVALVDGRPVGFSLNGHFADDEAVTGRRDGWIEVLGVAREWRRRGVASALIGRSLDGFRQAGFTHAMIGVDSDNPSGAAGLYSNLGFATMHRSVANQLRVPAVIP